MTTDAIRIKHINILDGKSWGGSDFLLRKADVFDSVVAGEVDLRVEMRRLLYGDGVTSGKGFTVIHRQVIKQQRGRAWNRAGGSYDEAESNDQTISRLAWPSRDVLRTTMEHKFMGTEYMTQVGVMDYDSVKFYFEWNANLDKDDKIIEVVTGDDGKPILPVRYIKRHSIKDVEVYHGIDGRIEYKRVIATKTE